MSTLLSSRRAPTSGRGRVCTLSRRRSRRVGDTSGRKAQVWGDRAKPRPSAVSPPRRPSASRPREGSDFAPGQALARTPGDAVRGGWTHGPGGTRCCDVVTGSRASPHLTELLKRIALKGNSWVVKPSSSRDSVCPAAGRGRRGGQSSEDAGGLLAVALGIQHARAKFQRLSAGGAGSSHTHGGSGAECLGQWPFTSFVLTQGIWPLPAGGSGLGAMDKACLAHLSPDRSR